MPRWSGTASSTPVTERADLLPLFPLQTVLFPGGLLMLKVFEARYLDLVTQCLRSGRPFGVVCLRQGARSAAPPGPVLFESRWACRPASTRSTANRRAS
jgi:Lon protease-like protein